MIKDVTYITEGIAILNPESDKLVFESPYSINTMTAPRSLSPVVVWKVVGVGLNLENFVAGPSAGSPGFGT